MPVFSFIMILVNLNKVIIIKINKMMQKYCCCAAARRHYVGLLVGLLSCLGISTYINKLSSSVIRFYIRTRKFICWKTALEVKPAYIHLYNINYENVNYDFLRIINYTKYLILMTPSCSL